MEPSKTTCWTLIQGAASGRLQDRDEFSRRYLNVVQAYLRARWSETLWIQEVEDAVQEVFVECFRSGGILEHVDSSRPGGFRAFLYGAVLNVARRFERRHGRQRERQAPTQMELDGVERDEATLSQVFDRAWALSLVQEALQELSRRSLEGGEDSARRLELLRLRFQQDLPVREIAARWNVDAAVVHRQYARARSEFKKVLLEVVGDHLPGSRADVLRECSRLLALLG